MAGTTEDRTNRPRVDSILHKDRTAGTAPHKACCSLVGNFGECSGTTWWLCGSMASSIGLGDGNVV